MSLPGFPVFFIGAAGVPTGNLTAGETPYGIGYMRAGYAGNPTDIGILSPTPDPAQTWYDLQTSGSYLFFEIAGNHLGYMAGKTLSIDGSPYTTASAGFYEEYVDPPVDVTYFEWESPLLFVVGNSYLVTIT